MAKVDILDILRSKKMDPMDFHFENLWIPPMHFYLSPQDVEELRRIATSVRLSSKIQLKYQMIDNVMRARGFKRFSAGTNRVVYRCLEDNRFLVKIAVDKVGMQDNPLEYQNQFLLQPFVTKMFYVSPCGTVGFSERVLPVKNKEEFREIASDVFDILVNKILGVYVVEDVGTRYFMNWGIRAGFGPVLLDYPYVYKLDGDKLFCTWVNPDTGLVCDGEIDYDRGFNHLVCTRCGKTYLATNLRDDSIDNKIVIRKGGIQMRVILKRGDEIIGEPIPMDDVMTRPIKKHVKKPNNGLVVCIKRPDSDVEEAVKENETVTTEEGNTEATQVINKEPEDNAEAESVSNNDESNDNSAVVNHAEEEPKDEVKFDYKSEIDVASNKVADSIDNEEDDKDIILASDINLNNRKPTGTRSGFITTSSERNKKVKMKRNKPRPFITPNNYNS